MSSTVELREVAHTDLDVFFHHQQDTESNDLAKVYPRDRADFDAHWERILKDPSVIARTIMIDGQVVGNINTFMIDDQRFVGYWIGRAHWGRGIATRALAEMVEIDTCRPIRAIVASENIGSIRALERAGFVKISEQDSEGDERFMACVESSYVLA